MCIYNVYEPVWHVSLWNKRIYEQFTMPHFPNILRQLDLETKVSRTTGTWVQDFFFFNFINKMCIYNVYEPVWHASLWNKREIWINGSKIYFQTKIHTIIAGGTKWRKRGVRNSSACDPP
jgi:hypothetical protein